MGVTGRLRRAAFVALLCTATCASAALLSVNASSQPAFGRPWLGVAMDVDAPGRGVRVSHVIRRSPADVAGIREGDRLVRVAEASVVRGGDVIQAVASHAVGQTVDVVFVRDGAEQNARVTLTAHPSEDDVLRMDLVGALAPTWRDVESVNGEFPPSVAAVRGRVVLLDFWATWCVPCRIVMPKLGALQARYGGQGLSVLGVSAEDAQEVASFAQRMPPRYAVAVDKHAQTTRSYGVVSLPTLIVIDKRGVVRDVSVGYNPMQDTRLEATVRMLLAEAPPGG
jgi:thiol-disulfide isomerase/thioredoxin